jgi:hypothetical protein
MAELDRIIATARRELEAKAKAIDGGKETAGRDSVAIVNVALTQK